ncbi:MAG: CotH kinase family protein [Prevotella sp.]|nr:CotH kinase family protein [Prevotella sp.]
MRHKLLLLLIFSTALSIWATPDFSTNKRYHIVCTQFAQGCVTDGATAQQQTPLYYLTAAKTTDETYWIFNEEQAGLFSIKNAKTGQFVTYDGVRDTYRRYLSMTDAIDGRASLWTISQQSNGIYTIRNAQQTDNIWDVRTDSYMVGTYANSGNGNQNQLFRFYDEQGRQVTERKEATDKGFDVSSWFEATTDALDGWQNLGGWFMNTGAGGSHYNGDASTVAPFIENWHATNYGPLDDCSLQQTLRNLPAGSYTLQADVIAVWQGSSGWYGSSEEPATGVSLFVNTNSTTAATANNAPERYTVDATLTATGQLSLGIRAKSTNANWLAIDNMALFYHGTESELLEGERNKLRAELADFYTKDEIEALIADCGNSFDQMEALRHTVATMPTIDPLTRATGTITIDGRGLAYAESINLYLCTLPLEHFGTDYTATIGYSPAEGNSTLSINGQSVAPGGTYTFANVSAGRNYAFSMTQADGTAVTKNVTFTSLPVVKMYGSFNDAYSEGHIAVHEPNKEAPQTLNMKAKWRGGITNNADKNKRNYHVKLKDANGDKLEEKFFGLRNDNSWILEACQVDMSRIRNRVLTDLWNDYSTPPYYIDKEPKARTGTRGQFVELILNDEYRGIYCMTENIDRKQLKLVKYDEETQTQHGQLWKSKDWTYATLMGTRPDGGYQPKDYLSDTNEYSDMWDKYQVKYPDFDDVQPTDWRALYSAVNFVCTANDATFNHYAGEYFDLPLIIDYYILMETILASDNHGKNLFFAIYDRQKSTKITLAVWDMDATCGQRWSDAYYHSSIMRPEQDYSEYIATQEHGDYNLFKRLRDTNTNDFNMQVRLRYRDLRQSFLATESILQRFRTYLDEFKTCGADKREYAKWSGNSDLSGHSLNFDTEMNYIEDWFTRRMNYLDTERFDIASLPEQGIASLTTAPSTNHTVYDLRGRAVGTAADFNSLPAGLYIIDGKKQLKK